MESFRWLSACWGGAGGAVLPIGDDRDGLPASRTLLAAVRRFDPDTVVHRPVLLNDLDDDTLRATVRAPDGTLDADTVALLRQDQGDTPIVQRDGRWMDAVRAWCAPRHPYDAIDEAAGGTHPLQYASGVMPPFTAAAAAAGTNRRSTAFAVDHLHPLLALMVVSRAGLPPDGWAGTTLVPGDRDLRGLAEWALTGAVAAGRLPCVDGRPSTLDDLGGSARSAALLNALPLPTTQAHLTWLHPAMWRHMPSVLVVGDTVEDHALSVLADRTQHAGGWAPAELLQDPGPAGDAVRAAAAEFVYRTAMGRPSTHETLVTSVSVDADRVHELLATAGVGPDNVSYRPAGEVLSEHVKLLGDPETTGRLSSHPVAMDNGTAVLLTAPEPLVPEAFRHGADGTWMVDVNPDSAVVSPARTAIPPSALLAETGSAGPVPETLVRAGSAGTTFWSESQGFIMAGALRDSTYARPLLRFPGAFDTVSVLATAAGMTARTSDAGLRAGTAARMWSGSSPLATDLRSPVRRLLLALAGNERNGPQDWGCVVNRRGHVHFDGARTLLTCDEEEARATLDRLVLVGAVRRGLLLDCARCGNLDFYRTAEISDMYPCKRCGAANRLVHERWRHPHTEPTWFYDADPVVIAFLEQHGDVPLVAAQEIVECFRKPADVTYEVEFVRDGQDRPWIEVDFACVVAGRLYVGEGKSNGDLSGHRTLSETVGRLAGLAVAVGADHVVLATSAAQWRDGQVDAVRAAVEREARRTGAPAPTVETTLVPLA